MHLQVLSIIGFCAGATMFGYGLRLRRIQTHAAESESNLATLRNPCVPTIESAQPVQRPTQEVIHLSPDRDPLRSAEMTQQQKIAAALAQAGSKNSAIWTARPEPKPETTSGGPMAGDDSIPMAQPSPIVHNQNLFVWLGSALALVSLFLFLSER